MLANGVAGCGLNSSYLSTLEVIGQMPEDDCGENGPAGSSSRRRRLAKRRKAGLPLSDITGAWGDYSSSSSSNNSSGRSVDDVPCYLLEVCCDELLVHILHWLPRAALYRVALTCTRMQKLVQDEALWKRVSLAGRTLPPNVLTTLGKRGISVLRAPRAIFDAPIVSTEAFDCCGIQSLKLQFLDLSMATLPVPELGKLLCLCPNMKKLSLESLQVSYEALLAISRMINLETLNLSLTRELCNEGFCQMVQACQKLQELNVAWTGLSLVMIKALVNTGSRELRQLNLSGNRDHFQDEHVARLCKQFPLLEELDLSDCSELGELAVSSVAENLHHLRAFHTSRCYKIVPIHYLKFSHRPTLKHLSVFGLLKEAALKELKERLPRVLVNQLLISEVARPTVGVKRTSIWGIRVRE